MSHGVEGITANAATKRWYAQCHCGRVFAEASRSLAAKLLREHIAKTTAADQTCRFRVGTLIDETVDGNDVTIDSEQGIAVVMCKGVLFRSTNYSATKTAGLIFHEASLVSMSKATVKAWQADRWKTKPLS